MLKVSDVVTHIEKLYKVELTDLQKDLLKHIIVGDVIYTPRGVGRSVLYNGYADYLRNVVGKTVDYSVNPLDFNKVYTYKDIIDDELMNKNKVEDIKRIAPELFSRNYECKY